MTFESHQHPDTQHSLESGQVALARAARIMLKDAPDFAFTFDIEQRIAWGEPGGDPIIAALIRFGTAFADAGYEAGTIQREAAIGIDILPHSVGRGEVLAESVSQKDRTKGLLVGLMGTDRLGRNDIPYIEGVAVITNPRTRGEEFKPVGILLDGTVFSLPPYSR